MLALRKVVKRYEYKPKEARGPLLEIMRVTLPLLLNMSLQLLGEGSDEAGQVRPCLRQLAVRKVDGIMSEPLHGTSVAQLFDSPPRTLPRPLSTPPPKKKKNVKCQM